ncbi:MAG: LysR family transcriptional regulator [Gammaproteobacteria bacterium]|nr:LysR family transcriptional regulator [Gammaproteobacteria bacterium]
MARQSSSRLYYKQNRLKQLRAFCCAAQTGSISKAAERLYLGQPSVTLQIQALERELGVALFERRGPKIQLTPDGRNLYELAQPLVHGIDTLSETFAAASGHLESGELSIGAGESAILYLLPGHIKAFADLYPGIRIKLQNVTGHDGLSLLRADEVDFAVGSFIEIPHDITYHPIFSYDPVLITPLGHPLSLKKPLKLEDISPYGLILPPRRLSTWRVVDTVFRQHNVDYHVTLEAGGWEVVKKYVELGLGVSIVNSICLTGNERLATLSLDQYFPKRSYGLVLRRGKFLTPQARLFIEMMAPNMFPGNSDTGRK